MERFGDFDLTGQLAKGGMAELFHAVHRPTGQVVVVKRLLPELEDRPDVVDLFLNEADIGRLLRHENVVQVLDAGEQGGRYWLAMEHIDGLDVDQLLGEAFRRGAPVPPRLGFRIGVEAARGLHAAHTLRSPQGTAFGLVHRDVSPDNLFVTREGVTKVADFGIAKLSGLEGLTSAGLLKGKLSYMSPEQVRSVQLDGRSDLFSLALVLYEMLSGHRPFGPLEGETEIDTLMRVRRGKVKGLLKLEPELPRAVGKVIDRALRAARWRRFASCGAFADALERAASSTGLLASREEMAGFLAAGARAA